MKLDYNDEKHEYTLGNTIIPNVTTIMKPLYEKSYSALSKEGIENVRIRGKARHNAIDMYLAFHTKDIEKEYEGYLNAFIDWFKKNNPKGICNELPMYHKIYMYAGTPDFICEIKSKRYLVDFKTYQSFCEKTERVQLEAYKNMVEQEYNIDGKMILILNENGTYKTKEYPAKDGEAKTVFDSLLKVHRYIEK